MNELKKHDALFARLGVCSLVSGLILYLLFRENTYIARIVTLVVPLQFLREKLHFIKCEFLQFYFPDYLWAFSLSCWLHIVLNVRRHCTWCCTMIVLCFGAVYELFQYLSLIEGTGDVVDVLLYLLAGLSVNIIYLKKEKKNEKG